MEGYVIAIILFLCALIASVIFFSFCYKKGNNNKKQHRPAEIGARQRNKASIPGQSYDSGGVGGGNYNGNDTSGGGAALVAGAAAMSAALTSIAMDGDGGDGGGDGGGGS